METPANGTKSVFINLSFWIGTAVASLFLGLMAYVSIAEWWVVGVKKQTHAYAWGPINENPWYYASPKLYSSVMFVEGILFILVILVLIRQFLKKDKVKILYCLLIGFGFFVMTIIMGALK